MRLFFAVLWLMAKGCFCFFLAPAPARHRTAAADGGIGPRRSSCISKPFTVPSTPPPGGHPAILRNKSRTILLERRSEKEADGDDPQRSSSTSKTTSDDVRDSVDFRILFADLIAITVACELMGLLDVLGDPTFWKNGGWFQAIPAAPSTLPVLVQRLSINSVLFVTASLGLSGYDNNNNQTSTKSVLTTALQTSGVFAVVRIAVGVALGATVLSENSTSFSWDVLVVEVLRECYVVALATTAGRYVLYSLFFNR